MQNCAGRLDLITRDKAEEAARMIHAAGVDDFNLDLIAALPGQKIEMLEHSIRKTIEVDAPHISVYVYRPDRRTVHDPAARRGYEGDHRLQKR